MSRSRVVFQRVVSPDGKVIAEAKSTASASGDSDSAVSQSVTVKISSGKSYSSSSSSSSASTSSSSTSTSSSSASSSQWMNIFIKKYGNVNTPSLYAGGDETRHEWLTPLCNELLLNRCIFAYNPGKSIQYQQRRPQVKNPLLQVQTKGRQKDGLFRESHRLSRGALTTPLRVYFWTAQESLPSLGQGASIKRGNSSKILKSICHCLHLRKVAGTPAEFPHPAGVPAIAQSSRYALPSSGSVAKA